MAHEPEFLTATAFVRDRLGVSGGEARRRVAEARGLTEHPQVREAFAAAVIDRPRVGMLLHAAQTASDTFVRDETVLVDTVAGLGMADSTRAVDYWRQAADRQAFTRDAEHAYQRRGLSVSETFGGMVRVDGELDPESGKTVIAALGSLVEPTFLDPTDVRTMRQRRADALVEICADHLAHGHIPISGGFRPQITLTVSPPVLRGEPGRPCELDGTVVTPQAAQRIACDATITPITRNGDRVLDVGRPPAPSPPPSAAHSKPATVAAPTPDADDPTAGAPPTTSPTGPQAETPASTTSDSSADDTTAWPTKEPHRHRNDASPLPLLEPVGDRQPPVAAQRLGGDLHAGGRLAPLVLVAVHHRRHPVHRVAVEARA